MAVEQASFTYFDPKTGHHMPTDPTSGMTTMDIEDVASRIKETAVLHGQFTLRSGRTSSYYIDKYLFSTRPDILRELGRLFTERIPEGTTGLAGAELGGIPLVTTACMSSGIPCIFIRNSRKEYGTSKQMEGQLEDGDSVVILEDVATTGGQAIEAASIIKEAGGTVSMIISVIDRLEGARENIEAEGIRFESLFTTRDLGLAGADD